MTDQKNHVQQVPFERAMTRCAIEAGNEPSFIRNGDGAYVQREMQAAFTGWCEAMTSIEAVLVEMAETTATRFHDGTAFQSGVLNAIEALAAQAELADDVRHISCREDVRSAAWASDDAARDDEAVDQFMPILKAKMAASRETGRGGWQFASAADLSRALREHVNKGDPRDVALYSLMLWHRGAAIEALSATLSTDEDIARSHGVGFHAVAGELVSVSTSAVMGGSLKVKADHDSIRIEGLPEAMARACRPLLFERVELLVRAEAVWMSAAQAAFESGVPINLVRGWAQAGEIDQRDHDGVLQVGRASLRARAHRYWQDRRQQAVGMETGSAS